MDRTRPGVVVAACFVLLLTVAGGGVLAESEEKKLGWSNSTDLSVVVTDGNSETETFGFKNDLRRQWKESRFQLKLDATKSDTDDDTFVLLEPGLTWLPGGDVPEGSTTVVDPGMEPDVEKYFAEASYDRKIKERLFWQSGGSWDRNRDAGILNRYIAFGGLGNMWKKKEGLELSTTYGLSYTDRDEEQPDPDKEERFAGFRLGWQFLKKFRETTTIESDLTANLNLEDTADYSVDVTNSVSVSISNHLALKVSLQHLYNSEPALEDVDIIVRAITVDPDGIPGSGDEFFETVESGGTKIENGETRIRNEDLDTVFRTSLVINF